MSAGVNAPAGSRVSIVPKAHISEARRNDMWQRIVDEKHALDVGPRDVWNLPHHERDLLAVIDTESGVFVGTVYCFVALPYANGLAWWIDSGQRGNGYWRDLADALARST